MRLQSFQAGLFFRMRHFWLYIFLPAVAILSSSCGNFMARRIAQAPNSYPEWLAPEAPVTLEFTSETLTAFPNEFLEVDAPQARLRYRVVEPADYEFRWTNRVDEAGEKITLKFSAKVKDLARRTNQWTANPRGTVVLVHGYGVAGFAMLPWAFLLGQEGWRCVLVDLRGHGKSTGDRVHFGSVESRDLSLLLDELEKRGRLKEPVSVLGDSLGGVVALRWKLEDARVSRVVTISPYANLGEAILNIAAEYAAWLPDWWIKAGVRKLPNLLGVDSRELNPKSWADALQKEEGILFVAGGEDRIAPVEQVRALYEMAGAEVEGLLVVPDATHEALPFMLDDLAEPVVRWLGGDTYARKMDAEQLKRSSAGGG
jgi:alpha-beta hydrolase superfamily lysophospholipase